VGRPRWFNLDAFSGPPRLTNWILRTKSMEAALAALPDGFGTPISLERGPFKWRMAVPDTGVLPWGGWAPAIIEWEGDAHPAQSLPDSGMRLSNLALHHPNAQEIEQVLGPLIAKDTALFMPDREAKLAALFDGRPAMPQDAGGIAEIYNQIIRDTTITFAPDEKSEAEIAALPPMRKARLRSPNRSRRRRPIWWRATAPKCWALPATDRFAKGRAMPG